MRSVASAVSSLVIGVSCMLCSAPGQAQSPDVDSARVLFEEGKSLLAQGRIADACPKLEQSLQLVEAGGTALNLARCRMLEGKLASAWRHYGLALSLAQKAGRLDREQEARQRMSEIEPLLSRLTVHAPAAPSSSVSVSLDGVALSPDQLDAELPVDGGTHRIEARAVGYEPSVAEVECLPRRGRASVRLPAMTLRPNVRFAFSGAPPMGTRIICDGHSYDPVGEGAIRLPPGTHDCEVSAPGRDAVPVRIAAQPADSPLSVLLPVPPATQARLAIRVTGAFPPGASLVLDDSPLMPGSHSVAVSRGLHRLQVRLSGQVIWDSAVSVAGPVTTVDVPSLRKPNPPSGPRRPYLAYGVGAFAAVSLLASSAFALDAVSKRNEVERMCPDLSRCSQGVGLNDRAGRSADYATVGLAAGLVGAGVFTYLFAIDRHPHRTGPRWELAPLGGTSTAGLSLSGALP